MVVGWAGERFLRQRIGDTNVSCTRLGCTSCPVCIWPEAGGRRDCIWPEAACASGQRPPKLHPGGSVPLPLPPRHHCVWPKAAGLIWPKAARVSLIIHPAATCAFAILSQSSSDKPSANSRKNTPPMLTCFKRFASSSQSSSSRPAINHRFMRSLKQA